MSNEKEKPRKASHTEDEGSVALRVSVLFLKIFWLGSVELAKVYCESAEEVAEISARNMADEALLTSIQNRNSPYTW